MKVGSRPSYGHTSQPTLACRSREAEKQKVFQGATALTKVTGNIGELEGQGVKGDNTAQDYQGFTVTDKRIRGWQSHWP